MFKATSRCLALSLSAVLLIPFASHATVIHVAADGSGDFPTIQAAIDAANANDVVLLGPGTYQANVSRNLDTRNAHSVAFLKAGVILEGAQGAAATIIDGQSDHHCVVGEDLPATTVVRGITLLNGWASGSGGNGNWGGCALLFRSSMIFENCVLSGGHAGGGAGLLFFAAGPSPGPIVRSCVFNASHSTQLGGGLEIYQTPFTIQNNTFVSNTASDNGGAILLNGASGHVDNNIFASNQSGSAGGGVGCINGAAANGSCNVFWQNTAPSQPDGGACTIAIGSGGNVAADPIFCDAPNGDFRLQSSSPAAPAHSGTCGLIGGLPVGCGPPPTTANLVIPEVNGAHGTQVTVPILLEGSAPEGTEAYQADLSFDPAIVSFVSAQTTGTLSDGMLVVGNSPSPGRLLVAAAGTTPLGDHAVLVNLIFLVSLSAPNGTHSPITFTSFLWGEGIAETSLSNGGVTVGNNLTAGGHVTYYFSGGPVPGVALDLAGSLHATTTSDSLGGYSFAGLWYGAQFSITPTSSSDVIDAVSALDASLVLQYLVQLTTLTPTQLLAADLTGDGSVSPADASRILLMVVGGPGSLPSPLWLFQPDAAHVDSLAGAVSNLDFSGILRGDVSGNWTPSAPAPKRSVDVAWTGSGEWSAGAFDVTFRLDGAGALGVDFKLLYDTNALTFLDVTTQGAGLWQTSATAGQVAVAGATAQPWHAGEVTVVARFSPARTPARRTEARISALRIDENPPQERTINVPGVAAPREGLADFDVHIVPNPAHGQVSLSVVGARGPVRLDVFDVTGRRVRAFGVSPDLNGAGALTWDRRDGNGSLVANGIYFLRATGSDRVLTKRIVVVR